MFNLLISSVTRDLSKAGPTEYRHTCVILNIPTDYFPIDKNYMTNAILWLQNVQLGG